MLYLIPAWYKENTWNENELAWHSRRLITEFDDTVKQVQLFHRSRAWDYSLLLLSFAPNLRHFLHRQSVYHAPYISIFDYMLGIDTKRMAVFSYQNLGWPDGIEFIFTPFVTIAMLDGKKYAQIDFGEDGNMTSVDEYENEVLARHNIYDDRGFLAAVDHYMDNSISYREYLDVHGKVRMTEYYSDGHVELNPYNNKYLINEKGDVKEYTKSRYDSLDDVIKEVLFSVTECFNRNDIYCVAMHKRHEAVLSQVLSYKKIILSFFGSRSSADSMEVKRLMVDAGYVITDSVETSKKVRSQHRKYIEHLVEITPYDTRVDPGISQQLEVQKVMLPIDNLDDEVFETAIAQLGEYANENEYLRIILFSRNSDPGLKNVYLNKVRHILRENNFPEEWAVEKEAKKKGPQTGVDGEEIPQRFLVEQCVTELSVSRSMREQRILMDLRAVPELYLQITAISMGVPQIVKTGTPYVKNNANGIILAKVEDIHQSLKFYLDTLHNWNDASVASFELGKGYTTRVLLNKWKEVFASLG